MDMVGVLAEFVQQEDGVGSFIRVLMCCMFIKMLELWYGGGSFIRVLAACSSRVFGLLEGLRL